jgi:hypothetical protein
MTRARDVSRLITTPPNIYATDSEASAGYLTLSSASSIYQGAPNRNILINGAMNVWQRGTSIAFGAAAYQYMQDRWRFVRGSFAAGATISRQTTSDTTNLPNIQYCARIQRDSGNTSTQYFEITQAVESANSVPFIGKSVVLSFYARAGANYSSSSNVLSALVSTGTGTDQAYNSFTNLTSVINQTATLTTTWQRFSYTGTVGLTATQIGVLFRYTPVGTAGANDYFEITGVQLEVGSSASAFEQRPVGVELALCQRYYEKSFPYSTAPQNGPNSTSFVTGLGVLGYVSGNSMQVGFLKFTVQKRIAPTMTAYGNSTGQTKYRDSITSSTDLWSVAALTFYAISESGSTVSQNVVNNVVVPVQGHWIADAEL